MDDSTELPALVGYGLQLREELEKQNAETRLAASDALLWYQSAHDDEERAEIFLEWHNEFRRRWNKKEATRAELGPIQPAALALLTIAANPLTTPISADFPFQHIATITEGSSDNAPSFDVPVLDADPDIWELYIRVRTYKGKKGLDILRQELRAYALAYPARQPWAEVVLRELDRLPADARRVNLCYAGEAATSSPCQRALDDLTDGEYRHFTNFCSCAANLSENESYKSAKWAIFRYEHTYTCTAKKLRTRMDLQAAEIACISAFQSFSLNSAFGGFHQLDVFTEHARPDASLLLTTTVAPVDDERRQLVERHCKDVRRICDSLPNSGPRIKDSAFNAVIKQATTLRAVDIPAEVKDESTSFYGVNVGPGPAWSLFTRRSVLGGFDVERGTAFWTALVGGYWDFWTIILVHLLVWLSTLFLIRYLVIARPLVIRVQSAKVCGIFMSGALSSLICVNLETRVILERFWSCQRVNWEALRACINVKWLATVWRELIPPGWTWWIGEVVVLQVGPDAARHWALVCLMGHDGRLKYDPSLEIHVARLHSVAQLIAALVEEHVYTIALVNPPPSDAIKPWLLARLKEINAKLDSEGIAAMRQDAREKLDLAQGWVVSKRHVDSYTHARREAEANGTLEQFEADLAQSRSERSKAVRARDIYTHVFASGEPHSDERQQQWTKIIAETRDLEACGVSGLKPGYPRPDGYDEGQWQRWWLKAKSGCDMTSALKAQNQAKKYLETYTKEKGMTSYRATLGQWAEEHQKRVIDWKSDLDIFNVLKQTIRESVPGPAIEVHNRARILTCTKCNKTALAGKNGKHRCQVDESSEWVKAEIDGVMTVHVYDVWQVLDHPLVGLASWKSSKSAELKMAKEDKDEEWEESEIEEEVNKLWEEELAEHNFFIVPQQLVDAALAKYESVYSWARPSLGNVVRSPIIDRERSSVEQMGSMLSQLGHECIRQAAQLAPETLLPSALELTLDDRDMWRTGTLTAIVNTLGQTKPMFDMVCAAADNCDLLSASHRTSQHACIAGMKYSKKGGNQAKRFAEIPVVWQHRIWVHIRQERGNRELVNWEAAD